MPGDIYQLLFGDPAAAEETSRAMSDLLRFKKGAALVGAQAGGPLGMAGMMEKQGAEEEKNLYTGLDKRLQYGQERQAHQDRLLQQAQQFREGEASQDRRLKMSLAQMAAGVPNWTPVNAPDGSSYLVNHKTGEVKPVVGGAPTEGVLMKKLPGDVQKKLTSSKAVIDAVDRALAMVDKRPGAFGPMEDIGSMAPFGVGAKAIGSAQSALRDPQDTEARMAVFGAAAQKLHELAGARGFSPQEEQMMEQRYIPSTNDKAGNVKAKLINMRNDAATEYNGLKNLHMPKIHNESTDIPIMHVGESSQPNRKTVGGKTYEKLDGKWFEVK